MALQLSPDINNRKMVGSAREVLLLSILKKTFDDCKISFFHSKIKRESKVLRLYLNKVISTALFYLGWVVCLDEASKGHYGWGALLILGIIAYFFYNSTSRKADAALVTFVIIIGPFSDLLYSQIGLLEYDSFIYSWIPPIWVFLLWGLFAVNIHLFAWLKERPSLSVLFGAIGGPLSYLSGVKLGVIVLLKPFPLFFLSIGVIWAVFFPFSIWLNDYLRHRLGPVVN